MAVYIWNRGGKDCRCVQLTEMYVLANNFVDFLPTFVLKKKLLCEKCIEN